MNVDILALDDEPDLEALFHHRIGLLTKPIGFALPRDEIDARLGQAA
jgi:hypothetical protein